MNISVVIPARLKSKRLPRKVLASINDKPMLYHVWQRVQQMQTPIQVLVATDSLEVAHLVESWGGRAIITSESCKSGTERIVSILDQLPGQIIINIQGDEPLIDASMLDDLAAICMEQQTEFITPVYRIDKSNDLFDPNVVKVVRGNDGRALYFSRSPIPYVRDLQRDLWLKSTIFWGHVGVYGYRRAVLENYSQLPKSKLEQAERLEQLRFLEAGITMMTFETDYRSTSVDTLEDLERVRRILTR